MYVRCDESSLYSRINYVITATTGNFSAGVGIIKTMLQELLLSPPFIMRTSAHTEETGRYDLAWKDLCGVLNALGK